MKYTNKITIRKSVNEKIKLEIPNLINDTLFWMKNKYPDVNFNSVEFIFSSNFKGSSYFRNSDNNKYPNPVVCISTRATLILYNMKRLKIKNTKLFVGSKIQMICALIHELTHHVQYENNLPKGELETTRNEIEYIALNHSKIYKKIMS